MTQFLENLDFPGHNTARRREGKGEWGSLGNVEVRGQQYRIIQEVGSKVSNTQILSLCKCLLHLKLVPPTKEITLDTDLDLPLEVQHKGY